MKDLSDSDFIIIGLCIFTSVSDFIMYKVVKYMFIRKLYNEEFAKGRYKDFLKSLIAIKSTIPVPIFGGIFYIVGRFVFHVDQDWISANPWIIGVVLVVSWIFWCLLLWICRRIYKKIRRNSSQKHSSSFYGKK